MSVCCCHGRTDAYAILTRWTEKTAKIALAKYKLTDLSLDERRIRIGDHVYPPPRDEGKLTNVFNTDKIGAEIERN